MQADGEGGAGPPGAGAGPVVPSSAGAGLSPRTAGHEVVKDEEGISESEQIRQAIRDWLRKKGVKKAAPRRVGARRRA